MEDEHATSFSPIGLSIGHRWNKASPLVYQSPFDRLEEGEMRSRADKYSEYIKET